MPKRVRLEAAVPWVRLTTTPEDWKAADPGLLVGMLAELHLIRAFEETVLELAGEGLVHGPAHSSIGQEGGAVGSIIGLRSTDAVNGSHRGHHQFLAKALTHVTRAASTPSSSWCRRSTRCCSAPSPRSSGSRRATARVAAARCTCSGSRPARSARTRSSAAASRWARATRGPQRHAGTDDLTVSYFGDGAVNIGSVLETMNLAAAWNLPFGFFIENNLYAVSTEVHEVTGEARLSGRGPGFGIPAWQVDGMDPLAVHLAMEEAGALMRGGEGPAVIEAEVYRFFHQNGPYPGSAFGYRSKDEETDWRGRDPLVRVAAELAALGVLSPEQDGALRSQAQAAMKDVAGRLTEADPEQAGKRRIRPELWPDPEFVDVGVRGDASELDARDRARAARLCGRDARRGSSSTRSPASCSGGWSRTSGSSCSARTCTGSTAARTARPRDLQRPSRTGCSARRSARTRSRASAAGWPSTAASVPSSSSCTRTSSGWRRTRCSTRSARRGTCSAAATRCRWCCARRSRWAPATARSI